MASNVVYLTEAGLQKLKDELDHLRSVERPAISAAIAEARDKGDLSENAEYDAAKEAQGMLEMRIAKLEDTVANARVIDESRIDTSSIQILNRVTLKNKNTGKSSNIPWSPKMRQTSKRVNSRSELRSPKHCWATKKAMRSM